MCCGNGNVVPTRYRKERRNPLTRGLIGSTGLAIRDLREARNLTLDDLAARGGPNKSTLSRLENGQLFQHLDNLINLTARALGMDPREIWRQGWIRYNPDYNPDRDRY